MIRKIKDRTRARFHLSLSEVGAQNTWQRVILGFALVGSERSVVENGLGDVVSSIEAMGLASLAEVQREILNYGDAPLAETMSGNSMMGASGRSRERSNDLAREPSLDPGAGGDVGSDLGAGRGAEGDADWDADWIPDSWKATDAGDTPPAGSAPGGTGTHRAGRGRR